MSKVLIELLSFDAYRIIEAIFSRLNLRLSQKRRPLFFKEFIITIPLCTYGAWISFLPLL